MGEGRAGTDAKKEEDPAEKNTGGKRSSRVNARMDHSQAGVPSQTTTNQASQQVWNFVSAPTLHPMKVTINVDKPGTASGFLFVAPYTIFGATMIGQTGALISLVERKAILHLGHTLHFRGSMMRAIDLEIG